MAILIEGHHCKPSTPLHDLALKKLQRLNRYSHHIQNIHVILEVEKSHHNAKATLTMPGIELVVHSSSRDMYRTIDELVKKLATKVKKAKRNH